MSKFYLILLLAAASAMGSPIGCNEDAHCPSSFFCEPDKFLCSKCIECHQLKRRPPLVDINSECIKKVTECGPCYKGLVESAESLIDAKCVSPASRSILQKLPTYAWAIALGMLLLGLVVCLVAAYVLRNFNTFKVLACYTRTSVQSVTLPRSHDAGEVVASAPPSYESVTGVPTDSASLEESRPFIQATEARDPDASQAPRMFTFSPPACLNGDTDTAAGLKQVDRHSSTRTSTTGQQRDETNRQTDSELKSSPTTVYPDLSLRTLSNKEETI